MARPRFSVVDRAGQPDYKPPLPGPRWADDAQVAQLVEHATENRSVGGSIPPLGTIIPLGGRWRRSNHCFKTASLPLAPQDLGSLNLGQDFTSSVSIYRSRIAVTIG